MGLYQSVSLFELENFHKKEKLKIKDVKIK
jgi:hypothetical protein